MHILYIFYSTFFDICCLRLGPQNLPISSVLLWLTLLSSTLISSLLLLFELSLFEAVLISIVETFLVATLTSSLLYVTHYLARFTQTLTALAGTNALLGMFSLLPAYWINEVPNSALPLLFLLGLKIWNITIYAHILRHALGVSFLTGLILTIINSLLIISVLYQIFPMNGVQ